MQQTVSAAGPRRVLGTPREDVPALRWLKCATIQSDMSRFFTARQHLLLCCEEAELHDTSKARTRILFPTLSLQAFPLNLCAGPMSPEYPTAQNRTEGLLDGCAQTALVEAWSGRRAGVSSAD
ncbi:MAG: uncharacterized protein A8A55_2510 [Amphiamblys sp. WSBS2006]|nr:MAG: uncharacterized protein A8A55_2510 [Amphiamblys sp. WSBS2006]